MRVQIKSQEENKIAALKTNASPDRVSQENEKQQKAAKGKGSSIYAGDLNLMQGDAIANKKVKAQRDAMKALLGQFTSDSEIDNGLKKRRENIDKMHEVCKNAQKEIREIDLQKEQLRESYEIAEDSGEQKDLELLIKQKEASKPGSGVILTREEEERLKNMGPLTEYQERALELEKRKGPWVEEITAAQKTIKEEVATIKAVEQELLKLHGMVDARNEADEILKNASKEAVGMLWQEAKEHIEEKMDETEEKIEEAREEKEEKEEQLEKLAEKKKLEEQETADGLMDLDKNLEEFMQSLNAIKEQEHMMEEDIKGLVMDILA